MFKRLFIFFLMIGLCSPALALQKNVASQKWIVYAFDVTDNSAVTGDAAQITANLRIDGAAADAVDDTNPAELEDGYYIFDLTQAETNGDYILIAPASSTADVQVIGVPGAVWTTIAQTGDAYAIVNNGTYGNSAIEGLVDDLESRLTATRAGYLDKLNVTGTLAHSDAAATYKADVSGLATQASVDTIDGIVDSILVDTGTTLNTHLTDIKGATFSGVTDSLEALRNRGDAAWITATGFSTHSAADVWAVATRQLTGTQAFDLTGNITGNLSGSVGSVSGAVGSVTSGVTVTTNNDKTGYSLAADQSAVTIGTVTTLTTWDKSGYALSADGIDAIWDEVQSGHAIAGSFGLYLDSAISGVSAPSSSDVADAVWDEVLSGHAVAGSAGKKIGDLPESGTGDWTADEKAVILEALSVEDGSVATEADLDGILLRIKKSRGR